MDQASGREAASPYSRRPPQTPIAWLAPLTIEIKSARMERLEIQTPSNSEPHRHNYVPGLSQPWRVDQTAAIRISKPDLDLIPLDRAQRIQ